MNVLSPWFLLGAALVIGPIVAHLIRRATRERVTFSALRFLGPSAPPLDRRSRIQNPWLLALRCAVVGLLALGFARPFLENEAASSAGGRPPRQVVVLLDESASMRRTGLWSAAKDTVLSVIEDLRPTDQFALVSSGSAVVTRVSPAQWTSTPPGERIPLLRALLADLEPGWGPSPLDSAAEWALVEWEEMAETGGGEARRELVIVSDFAAGTSVAGFAQLDWPPTARVFLLPVFPADPGNASLQWLGWTEQAPNELAARVRLSRSFDAPDGLTLRWSDATSGRPLSEPTPVSLLPGGSEVRLLPLPQNSPETLRLDVDGDPQNFDNRLWLVRPQTRDISIAYLGAEPSPGAPSAQFFLERAVAGWRAPSARIVAGIDEPERPALLVIAAPQSAAAQTELRARLAEGAFAVVLLNSDEMVVTASALAGETWQPATTARPDALFGRIDFQHPLFAPFADPLYSNFARIRFWAPRSVQLPSDTRAVVAARFDDDSPAVLEVPVGRGRLVVWGSDWTAQAGQWVLSSKFVPWLQALAERASGGAPRPAIAEVGTQDRIAATGAEFRRIVGESQAEIATGRAEAPGIYSISENGRMHLLALNVPAAESQTDLLSLDTWEQLGVPIREEPGAAESASPATQRAAAQAHAVALEAQQQWWRWLLWFVVALLAVESVGSYLITRRTASGAEQA